MILNRNESVSIAKAIGIILMVLEHSKFSSFGGDYICMFHMPLFFFFSGYCFKEKYLDNFYVFLRRKVTSIYIPYVFFGILFLLFHNSLCNLYFYDINSIHGYLSDSLFIKKLCSIVFMMVDHDQLIAGYWFLHSLMFSAVLSYILIKFYRKNIVLVIVVCLIVSLSLLLFTKNNISKLLARDILSTVFLLSGYFYKKNNYRFEEDRFLCLFFLSLVWVGTLIIPCRMISLRWQAIIPYYFFALFGIFAIFHLSKQIVKWNYVALCLKYIGDNTLCILTFHIVGFKLLSIFFIYFYGFPLYRLGDYPVLGNDLIGSWRWLLYFIIGLLFPLLINIIYKQIIVRLSVIQNS